MSADLPLSSEDVEEIVSILDSTPYDRIEIRSSRFSLAVIRSGDGWVQSWEWSKFNAPPLGQEAETSSASGKQGAGSSPSDVDSEGFRSIRALLPGTFYRAPQPGAAPFIELGSNVLPDSVVGIIETMKLMTPVHAGVRGVVVDIMIDNAAIVDASTPLVRVKLAEI